MDDKKDQIFDGLSYQEILNMKAAADTVLRNRLQKGLSSENFDEVLKAQTFL